MGERKRERVKRERGKERERETGRGTVAIVIERIFTQLIAARKE